MHSTLPINHPALFQNVCAALEAWIVEQGGDPQDAAIIWHDERDERSRRVWRITPMPIKAGGAVELIASYFMEGSTSWHMSPGLFRTMREAGRLEVVKAGVALPDKQRWYDAGSELVCVKLEGETYWLPRHQIHKSYASLQAVSNGWAQSGVLVRDLAPELYSELFKVAQEEAEQHWRFW